jgi:nitrite reductase/ring-hydroxylating ferredoxin subunit
MREVAARLATRSDHHGTIGSSGNISAVGQMKTESSSHSKRYLTGTRDRIDGASTQARIEDRGRDDRGQTFYGGLSIWRTAMPAETKKTRGRAARAVSISGLLCVCLTGCSTFKYVNQTPLIKSDAYAVEEDKTVKVTLAKVPELSKVGGSVAIMDPKLPEPVIIARTGDKDYVVACSKCPHRAKALSYSHENKRFECSSLGSGKYGVDGKKISGPGEGCLKLYPAELENGVLTFRVSDK